MEPSAGIDSDAGLEVEDLPHLGDGKSGDLTPVDRRRGGRLVLLDERPFGHGHHLLADFNDGRCQLEIDRRGLIEGYLDIRDSFLVEPDAGGHDRAGGGDRPRGGLVPRLFGQCEWR